MLASLHYRLLCTVTCRARPEMQNLFFRDRSNAPFDVVETYTGDGIVTDSFGPSASEVL